MATVKYNGEFPEGQDSIEHLGETFERGKSTTVTDKETLAKLAANRFFEVSGESDKEAVKQGQAEAEAAESATVYAWLKDRQVPAHHRESLSNLNAKKDAYLKAQEAAAKE